jgi:cell division protein FtsW
MPRSPDNNPARRHLFGPANVILVCAVGLALLGLTVLFSASASFRADPYFFIKRQVIWVVLAVAAGWVVSRVDLEHARRYAWIIWGATIVLLILVLIPGIGVKVNGARRWIDLGMMRLQVSDVAKFAMVFALAHYCNLNQRHMGTLMRGFVIPAAGVGLTAFLIIVEPDFGTAALTGIVGVTMLYLAGVRLKWFVPAVASALLLFAVAIAHNPNKLHRITSFLDVEANKGDGAYQLWQAMLAFGAGGIEGVGLGNGRQQNAFLPEAHTDFIFAIVGEELGLGFTLGVVVLFMIILGAGLVQLRRAPNLFGYLLVAGMLLMMMLQAIINLGVVTGVLPTKGMSLPFISYGGSNLLLMGVIVGVFFNTQRAWGRPNLGPDRRLTEVAA